MSKTATIRTRIEPSLKSEAEDILAQLGLTASETVQLLYRQIKLHRGLPFDVRIPNALTTRTPKKAPTFASRAPARTGICSAELNPSQRRQQFAAFVCYGLDLRRQPGAAGHDGRVNVARCVARVFLHPPQ
jgi:DNA-damage-inducible protein J